MLIRRFIELLTPLSCLGCGAEGAALCVRCLAEAGARSLQRCCWCGLPTVDGATCEPCQREVAIAGVSVGAYYDGPVKEAIWRLKFSRLRAAAGPAAELVVRALPRAQFDLVTAVPMPPARYRERGYNQAELIGRAVAVRLGVPYAPLLGRSTTAHQLGQGREARLVQVRGAFWPRRGLRGERVLVVDDVVTTAATLNECARTLLEAGAAEVWGGAVARH